MILFKPPILPHASVDTCAIFLSALSAGKLNRRGICIRKIADTHIYLYFQMQNCLGLLTVIFMSLGVSSYNLTRTHTVANAGIQFPAVSIFFLLAETCGQVRDKFLRPVNFSFLLIHVIRARLRVLIEVDISSE